MQAHKLIQIHGFKKAFDVAVSEGNLGAIREIPKIERRMFGTQNNPILATSQFPLCANPLRLDPYKNCEFGCSYCFAGNNNNAVVIPASSQKITNSLNAIFNGDKVGAKENLFAEMVKLKWPIHIGGMSDPMPGIESRKRILFRVLQELLRHRHPVVISTKSVLPLQNNDYVDLFRDIRNNLIFQMSLITAKNHKFLERHVPSPKLRINTLEKLCDADINCVVRLQPFMWQLLEEQKELFKIYADIGVKAVIVEGLKIKSSMSTSQLKLDLIRTFGIEINKELSARRYNKSIYPIETKVKYHRELRDIAHSYGLIYLVADNNLRFMGDSPNCCGTDLINAQTNDFNITNLSYHNPSDFGFHLIENESNDFLMANDTTENKQLKGKTIHETLHNMYNSSEWMFETYKEIYTDSNGNKHYRINSELF